jgi:hypothetical protein
MRSQIGIEFLSGITILLFIYVITISAFGSYSSTTLIDDEEAHEVCYAISRGINSAVIGGSGFGANITLPASINQKPYNVVISANNTVTVSWEDKISACTITTRNVTTVAVYPSKISINNVRDRIYVTGIATDKDKYNLGETTELNGTYFINNATLSVAYANGTLFLNSTNYTTTNGFFEQNLTLPRGILIINAHDSIYKTLSAQKDVQVI